MNDWYELQAGFHDGSRSAARDLREAVRLVSDAVVTALKDVGQGLAYAWKAAREDVVRHTVRSPLTALLVVGALAFALGWLLSR